MAEHEPTAISPADRVAAPFASRFLTREVAVSLALVVLTFAIFWFLGPKDTPYSYQVSMANNILHGHLDLKPEYTENISVLEQVLYDGERFCLPPNLADRLPLLVQYTEDIAAGVPQQVARDRIISQNCKTYMQHSLGPAFVVMPGVLIWGKELNQALVSAVIGALTAPIVYAIARKLTRDQFAQIALTVLMLFGTIFWFVAANGGVWFFAHTMATFFLFAAIYFTIVRPTPIAAGALLGAAFMSRPTVITVGLFFVVMFSELWLRPRMEGFSLRSLPGRINWAPILQFAAGLAPIIILNLVLNYLRYDNPFESGYNYVESSKQVYLAHIYNHGTLDINYLERHPPVIFEAMPVFQRAAPYVLPSWFGMAMWATTPAFLYAFFPGVKRRWVVWGLVAALALAIMAMIVAAASRGLDLGPLDHDFTGSWDFLPFWDAHLLGLDLMGSWEYLPFYAGAVVSIAASTLLVLRNRDLLAFACWAAIIPTVLTIFSFAFTGHAQFGYRYGLDFYPFVWLLVGRVIADGMKWHHWALIALSVAVNLWGVLWIYQFQPDQAFGVDVWVTF